MIELTNIIICLVPWIILGPRDKIVRQDIISDFKEPIL